MADQATKQAAAQWELERSWPLWQVVLGGEEVEWAARAGVNLDDDGNPQPWRAPARAVVSCRARNEDHARALALAANPAYHTIDSAKQVKEATR